MPPRPLSVHALAQALANVRPPTPSGDDADLIWYQWLATCRSIQGALPEDFAHNFVLLCKTLAPQPQKD